MQNFLAKISQPEKSAPITTPTSGKNPNVYFISFSSSCTCGTGILEYIENANINDFITDI